MDDKNKQPEQGEAPVSDTPEVVVGGQADAAPLTPVPAAAPVTDKPEEENIVPTPVNNVEVADNGVSQSWSGPEFIAYDKTSTWYLYLLVICVVLCALVLFFLRDIITTLVIVVAFVLIGVYGSRKPKPIVYSIDNQGVEVAKRRYLYNDFRNYNLIHEGNFTNVTFMPLKRFAMTISIYFPPQSEKVILDIISQHLPYEEHKPDLLERVLARVRY